MSRVLIAKVGLDGHESSAKLIALTLSKAGFEVIYTGPRQTPRTIVSVAEQEDVDLIGISVLSGAHMYAARETLKVMRDRNVQIPLVLGGIIPSRDVEALTNLGVAAVFGPGSSLQVITETISRLVRSRAATDAPATAN